MRCVAHLLIRLYPASWRARYGEEFEALLEDSPPGWRGTFDLVKGAIKMQLSVPAFPKLALMPSIAGLLAGLAISFVVDPRYVSTATMTLGDSVGGSSSSGDHSNPAEYFARMRTEILSRTSLSSIIQDPHLELYKSERARIPLEDVIEKMRQDTPITMEAPGPDYLVFRITFAYGDRAKAQDTVKALINKFEEGNRFNPQPRRYDRIDRMEARLAALQKELGIAPAPSETSGGIVMQVVDPPSLPVAPVYPDRFLFMATGFGVGLAGAVVIAVFRRRPPPIPFPAQTA